MSPEAVGHAGQADAQRHRQRSTSTATARRSRASTSAARPARPRSGTPRTEGAWKINKFNYSFIGYIGREKGHPDLVVAVRIEEGTPTVIRVGHLEMPVMSFELFRRIAHDAISTPDLVPGATGSSRRPRDELPVTAPVRHSTP